MKKHLVSTQRCNMESNKTYINYMMLCEWYILSIERCFQHTFVSPFHIILREATPRLCHHHCGIIFLSIPFSNRTTTTCLYSFIPIYFFQPHLTPLLHHYLTFHPHRLNNTCPHPTSLGPLCLPHAHLRLGQQWLLQRPETSKNRFLLDFQARFLDKAQFSSPNP